MTEVQAHRTVRDSSAPTRSVNFLLLKVVLLFNSSLCPFFRGTYFSKP